MIQSRYRFFLTIADGAGGLVCCEEVDDFAPCYEDVLFSEVCAGAIENTGRLPLAVVEPVWMDGSGGRVAGVTVKMPPLEKTFGLSVVSDRVLTILVEQRLLADDGHEPPRVSWWLEAEPCAAPEASGRLRIALSREPYPLVRARPGDFGIAASALNDGAPSLFVRRDVLEALREETARALDVERADVLTGHLVQDPGGRVAVVVTGRIPAVSATAASRSHFAFSPVTFTEAREEAARKSGGAIIVGWHHNHPPCRDCPLVVPPCATSMLFFSVPHDRAVHRGGFPAPYMIALVSGKEAHRRADEPAVHAWGWRDGAIVRRPFTVFP